MKKQGLTLMLLIANALLLTACMPKQDGKYHSKYSYHPYHSLKPEKAIVKTTNIKVAKVIRTSIVKEKQEFKAKGLNPFQTVELYPSNVPAQQRY